MPVEKNNIELRSEEIQEIIGFIPSWIIRWGVTIIFITIVILIVGSAFFKYPDVITSTIVVTTENPPANIVARTNGKIDTLFVKDKQNVNTNQILAIIDNPANSNDVLKLSEIIDTINVLKIDSNTNKLLLSNLNLGEIQSNYSTLQKNITDYNNFKEINFHHQKIKAIENQITATNQYISNLISQQKIISKELKISIQQLKRDSLLLKSEAISLTDYENTQTQFLQKQYSYQSAKTTISNTKIQISQLEQSILDLKIDYLNEKNRLEIELQRSFDILKSSIKSWEQNYVLRSPINGQVVFSKVWSDNQNVLAGDIVFNIIPQKQSEIIGRLKLPIEGAGKVKETQTVNVKFSNYPHMEYGIVKAKIKSISEVPFDDFYTAIVIFPDSLTTNYGENLIFTQEMSGIGEIITQDISLFSRLFSPAKHIKEKFKQND